MLYQINIIPNIQFEITTKQSWTWWKIKKIDWNIKSNGLKLKLVDNMIYLLLKDLDIKINWLSDIEKAQFEQISKNIEKIKNNNRFN